MKDYVFWGWDSEAVAPVNERYKAIKDQRELYDLMKEKLEYTLDYEQSREAQFSNEEKYGRYLLLKKNLDRKLGLED